MHKVNTLKSIDNLNLLSNGRKRKGDDVGVKRSKVFKTENDSEVSPDYAEPETDLNFKINVGTSDIKCSDRESEISSDDENCCELKYESSSLRRKLCRKNPEHLTFIPVYQFSYEKLPDPYKDPLFDDLVKHLSQLVVRINVKSTSLERPPHFPKSKGLYGSGKICFSLFHQGKNSYFNDQRAWGAVRITTASHVLFDAIEAKHTTCDLFFDSDKSDVKTLPCYKLEYSNVKNDRAVLVCITDDLELIRQLGSTIELYRNVHEALYNKYRGLANNNLVICISHPHGCPKHVSFGPYVKREKLKKAGRPGHSYTRYYYDVPTCRSSSGAPLYIVSKKNSWTHHPHSGFPSGSKHGLSGAEWEESR